LVPGGSDPANIAKKIKSEFVRESGDDNELAGFIKSLSVDEFVRTIPYGKSKISFTERGEERRTGRTEALATSTEQSN